MIKIEITQTAEIPYVETVNLITKRTPTDQRKASRYGSEDEVIYTEESAPTKVKKTKTIRTTLLTQEIEDDAKFDLVAVISAINKIDTVIEWPIKSEKK